MSAFRHFSLEILEQRTTSDYPATLFACVDVLSRTRNITIIVSILIQWDAGDIRMFLLSGNSYKGILSF